MAAEGLRPWLRAKTLLGRQWGRDRMAAEGLWGFLNRGRLTPCVNGAATGWPRKGDGANPPGWQE